MFGVIGMELFAGTMHHTINEVKLSSYGLNRYYMNTFDNIYSTFMTLFELMVVNNWNIIMEGYVACTNSEWTRLYFIVWFIVSVVVVMNVCAGFVIDAYSLLKPKMKEEVKYLQQILDESAALSSSLDKNKENEEYKRCDCIGGQYPKFKAMNLKKILSYIDTEYMISNMPSISKNKRNIILFDQQLQNQLGIRVREHEHSYSQLTKVFDDHHGDHDDHDDRSR
mgnify:CR=1 FL=1|jgi:hypothetical protein